ncbi:hypothetical protein [Escherichia phage vB_EcoM_IME392]|nr:hypothetical protein [Escherichia phage vB_EcoM_IME392]
MYKVTNKSEYTVQANLSADGPVSIAPKESLTIRNPSRDFVKEIGRVSNLLSYTEVSGDASGDQTDKDEVVVAEPEHPNSLDKEPGTVIQGTALTKEEINTAAERSDHKINDKVPDTAVVGANQDAAAPKTGGESNVAPKEVTDAELNNAGAGAAAGGEDQGTGNAEDASADKSDSGIRQFTGEEPTKSEDDGEGEQYTREELESTHWATVKSIAESNGIDYTNKGEAITAILDAKVTK